MKPRSAKSKGRRPVAELRAAILKAFPMLEEDDIQMVPTSVGGADLKLSPAARRCWPLDTEVKNQEHLSIWQAIKQAEANSKHFPPAVAFRRNRHPLWVAVSVETMLHLLQANYAMGQAEERAKK
jgi:hypothetical protein